MAADLPLGTRIKRARERMRVSGHYMSQQELADALGVSRSAVNAWENNRAHPRSSIGALEAILGVTLTGSPDVLVFRGPEEEDFWRNLQTAGVGEDERRKLLEQFRRNREAPVRREAG